METIQLAMSHYLIGIISLPDDQVTVCVVCQAMRLVGIFVQFKNNYSICINSLNCTQL